MENILIRFQIYLNDKGLITDYDWDYEKLAKQFLKYEQREEKRNNKIEAQKKVQKDEY